MPSRTFPFTNVLRGRMAERIITILLERAAYRVTRLGIEELFDEVKYLNREQYVALGLPEQLRTLPDLLVADPGVTWAKLIEVKFRRSFDRETADELFVKLSKQRCFWPGSYAVIIVGQPFLPDARFHQDYIRVIPPDGTELLKGPQGVDIPANEKDAMRLLWEQLPMLTKIIKSRDFEHFGEEQKQRDQDFWKNADSITAAIRDLGRI